MQYSVAFNSSLFFMRQCGSQGPFRNSKSNMLLKAINVLSHITGSLRRGYLKALHSQGWSITIGISLSPTPSICIIFTLSSDWLSSWMQGGSQELEWIQASLCTSSRKRENDFLPMQNKTPFPSSDWATLVTCPPQPTNNSYQVNAKCPLASQGILQTWIQLPLNHMG